MRCGVSTADSITSVPIEVLGILVRILRSSEVGPLADCVSIVRAANTRDRLEEAAQPAEFEVSAHPSLSSSGS